MRMERWPTFHQPALRWLERVERAVRAQDHPDQGAFIAIINAIEYQFENGADPETVRHLLAAFAAFVSACGISLHTIGLDPDPATTLARLAPGRGAPR
jgi:hypothetical protein